MKLTEAEKGLLRDTIFKMFAEYHDNRQQGIPIETDKVNMYETVETILTAHVEQA